MNFNLSNYDQSYEESLIHTVHGADCSKSCRYVSLTSTASLLFFITSIDFVCKRFLNETSITRLSSTIGLERAKALLGLRRIDEESSKRCKERGKIIPRDLRGQLFLTCD